MIAAISLYDIAAAEVGARCLLDVVAVREWTTEDIYYPFLGTMGASDRWDVDILKLALRFFPKS
jgi:hypothetical protein